jgi:hypothetical protein
MSNIYSWFLPLYTNAEFCWTNNLHICTWRLGFIQTKSYNIALEHFAVLGSVLLTNLYLIYYPFFSNDGVPTYRMQLRMWTIQGYWCSLFSLVLYIMLHNWEFVKTTADNFKIHEFWQNNFHLKFIQTTIMLTDCIIATSRCCKSNNVRTQSN